MPPHMFTQVNRASDVALRLTKDRDDKLRVIPQQGIRAKIAVVSPTHGNKSVVHQTWRRAHRVPQKGIQERLKYVIAADGTTLRESLEETCLRLNTTLASTFALVKGRQEQLPYEPSEVFTLEKWGSEYRMVNAQRGAVPCVDGYYLFIIPYDAPYTIRCAVLAHQEDPITRKPFKGHASFANVTQVHFAGVMKFAQRRLVFWSNASGHFMPKAEARYALLPYLKCLLPESCFVDLRFLVPDDIK